MHSLFVFGAKMDNPPSCCCIRCDKPLPPLHFKDHLCDDCFIIELDEFLEHLKSEGMVDDDTTSH